MAKKLAVVDHAHRAHSKIGASKAHRWMNCAGSVALEEIAPKQVTNPAAELGTCVHEASEFCINHALDADAVVGMTFNNIEFPQDMVGAAQTYIDFVRETFAKYAHLGAELHIEKKFRVKAIHTDLYGTSDATIVIPFLKIIVIDYKNGKGLVEVEDNPQLKIYGVGASWDGDFGDVELVIVQPNADHEDGPIRSWTTTHDKLIKWAKTDLKEAIRRTEQKDAPLKTGEWCQYCPAAAICPAMRAEVMATTKSDFDDAPALPDVEGLSDHQIVKILEHKSKFENWFKSVKDYALTRMVNGEKIPGLKLVRGKGSRAWLNEQTVIRKFGLDIMEEPKLLSVSRAEKILGKKTVEAFVKKYEGNVTVAHEDDKRKAVSNAKDDFTAIAYEVQNDEEF